MYRKCSFKYLSNVVLFSFKGHHHSLPEEKKNKRKQNNFFGESTNPPDFQKAHHHCCLFHFVLRDAIFINPVVHFLSNAVVIIDSFCRVSFRFSLAFLRAFSLLSLFLFHSLFSLFQCLPPPTKTENIIEIKIKTKNKNRGFDSLSKVNALFNLI